MAAMLVCTEFLFVFFCSSQPPLLSLTLLLLTPASCPPNLLRSNKPRFFLLLLLLLLLLLPLLRRFFQKIILSPAIERRPSSHSPSFLPLSLCPARVSPKRPWIKCSSIPPIGDFCRTSFLCRRALPAVMFWRPSLHTARPCSFLSALLHVTVPPRDACAHLLLPLNKCRWSSSLSSATAHPLTFRRRDTLYAPWKCTELRHG